MQYKKLATTFLIPYYDTHFENLEEIRRGYQHALIEKVLPFCKQNGKALDVGAHIGMITYQILSYFKKIHTFEPCIDNFNCLIKNIISSKVTHHNIGLSDKSTESILYKNESNSGEHTLNENKFCKMEKIRMRTLDSLKLFNIDFIKIDVQDWELKVLMGGEKSIKKWKPVILVEDCFGKNELLKKRKDISEVQNYLKKLGMTFIKRIGKDVVYHFK